MGRTLDIRRYRPPDRERVESVIESALRDAGAYFEEPPDAAEPIAEAYLREAVEFIVGELGGTLVATGALRPVEGIVAAYLDSFDAETIEIKRMHVHPDYQRRGYGQQILDELQRRARARGRRELVLSTSDLQTAACRFYESNGFEEVGRDSIEAFDRSFDVVVYRKSVPTAGTGP